MKILDHIETLVKKAVAAAIEAGDFPDPAMGRIEIDIPQNADFGDFSTNFAMKAAKPLGMKPRDIAERLIARLNQTAPEIKAAVAGPGFINLTLPVDFWQSHVGDILQQGQDYGRSDLGNFAKINVEYVSANPTGPLHVGHVRGAVLGQTISNILEFVGYDVTREYYINDAGLQVEKLGRSAYLRYREALGEEIGEIPEGYYPGDYLVPVGQALAKQYGGDWLDKDETEWLPVFRAAAIDAMMAGIRADLESLGIPFDIFSSEKALIANGKVEESLKVLESKDLVYMGTLPKPQSAKADSDWSPEPLPLFRSSRYGDEVDRPLKKSNGELTYFASDIAYHYDKFLRGHKRLINIWGADHAGYVPRLSSAVAAITDGQCSVEVKTCQMVKLMRGQEEVKMSKRAGTFVTLRDVIEEVGKDIIFFVIATKSGNTPFNFDLEQVKRQSMDNPVFYVQYAHARASSVLHKAAEKFGQMTGSGDLNLDTLTHPDEIALIRKMSGFQKAIQAAAEKLEPHIITDYLYDLAASFHSLWNHGQKENSLRFIQDDPGVTAGKIAMVRAFQTVIANGLRCCNVTPIEMMERQPQAEELSFDAA